jgi:hypothetical protein
MEHIVADEELECRLRGFLEPIEIRDSRGKVLGHYTPFVTPEELAAHAKASELFDLEEAERTLAEAMASKRPVRSLKEILEELRSSEKQGCATP